MPDRGVGSLPRRFGRYELTSLLGQGGMGTVYGATLTGPSGFRKQVALKVIRARDGGEEAASLESFIQEARVCGLLRHPNVVDVYDFGATDGQPWLAMEMVDGWPLDAILSEHELLPPTVVLDLAIQVAEGLMHAHELQDGGALLALVHRDLKPANVLVSRQGVAKVMDFGLARATLGDDAMTTSGTVRGTPAYMSPEQASGDELDPRSDLFSFGILLFELAVGERPFLRENVIALIMALISVEDALADPAFLGRPESRVPGIGPILRGCLRRDPGDRFDRARDLVESLRALLRVQPAGPSLRSWIDAVVLGNAARAAHDLGSVSWAGAEDASTLTNPALKHRGDPGSVASQGIAARTNLSPEPSVFVGRSADLTHLGELVDGGARLVSIVGPAGTGKTRFARAFAQSGAESWLVAGGMWFCDLAPAQDLLGVLSAVAGPLGVPLDRARGEEAAIDQVGYAIAGRGKVLLILDNIEQVLEPAGRALKRWLEIGEGALFLVTSRERVRVAGAREVEIGPLDTESAVQLFRARARAVRPDFALTDAVAPVVERIVRRLDRIPLAIELAAARAGVLSPTQIHERLSERFKLLRARRSDGGRQATLRDAIEWSWNLLDAEEQSALAQCSVFRGSFDLEAVEAVVALDGGWALDAIEALRDKSLVWAEQVRDLGGSFRFRLYESIREFAAEQLDDAQRAAVWERHAQHYVTWGESRAASVEGPRGRRVRRELALELDNLHAIFARHAGTHPELAVRAALVMTPVLLVTGPLDGHIALIEAAVGLADGLGAPDRPSRLLLARLLHVRGGMRSVRADFDPAEVDLRRALEIARQEAERHLEGETLGTLARALMDRGATHEGEQVARELSALAEAAADRGLEAEALWLLGRSGSLDPERFAHAETQLHAALRLCLELGKNLQAARITQSLAVGVAQSGQHARAVELLTQAMRLHEDLGHRRGQASCLANLGLLGVQAGDFEGARADLLRALRMLRRLGSQRNIGILLMNIGTCSLLLGLLDEALTYGREAAEHLERFGNPYYAGAAWRYLGSVLHLHRRYDEAEAALSRAAEILVKDEGGWMIASVIGCRAALAADRDRLVEADMLLGDAERSVTDPSGLAFLSLCRGHVELAQARATLAGGDPGEAEVLQRSAERRLSQGGFDEPLAPNATQEATNRVAGLVLSQALDAHRGLVQSAPDSPADSGKSV